MAKVLNRFRRSLSDLNFDFSESEIRSPKTYQLPSRIRGEVFNQPPRTIYVYGSETDPIPVSFSAFHDQRLIVVEIEVATYKTVNAEWPSLEKRKTDFANQIVPKLRSLYVGGRAKMIRLLRRRRADYQVQGPFIPHQQGIAVVSLVIRVGLDSNFDDAYRIAQRFLELHPENENRDQFEKHWAKPKPPEPRTLRNGEEPYEWTKEELKAVESMAPLEPTMETFGCDRTEGERLKFNEIVWRQCQQRLSQIESGLFETENEASDSATTLLKDMFDRRVY